MLASDEVLYANFICRNINFVHHVVEFLLITSGSRWFPVNSSPSHQQEENEAHDVSN
jgi:hypothetical protein